MDVHSDADADEIPDLYDPTADPEETPIVEFPLAYRAEREEIKQEPLALTRCQLQEKRDELMNELEIYSMGQEVVREEILEFDTGTSNLLLPERDKLAKTIPISSREVPASSGETLTMWKRSIRDELDNLRKMQGLYDADPDIVSKYKLEGKTVLPCKMVFFLQFVKKVLTPAQVEKIKKETGERRTWKAKSRM
eukprot:4065244-Amphidinium_carterae.1